MANCYASIDLGTNACKFYVIDSDGLSKEFLSFASKKAGEKNMLDEETILSNLKAYKERLSTFGIDLNSSRLKVVATEGFRSAGNAPSLLKKIEKTGYEVEVLTQKREAELGAKGACSKFKNIANKHILVIDAGGGSTDVSLVDNRTKKMVASVSIPLGSQHLPDSIFDADSKTFEVRKNVMKSDISKYLEAFIKDSNFEEAKKDLDILSTSTVTRGVIAKHVGMEVYNAKDVAGMYIGVDDLTGELNKLSKMKPYEIVEQEYVSSRNVSQFYSGVIVLNSILSKLDIGKEVKLYSTIAGVKEGAVIELIEKEKMGESKEIDSKYVEKKESKGQKLLALMKMRIQKTI